MITKNLLLFCLFISFNLNAQIPTDGLVAHYPLNGTAIDSTSNGNDGVLNSGVTPTLDRFGVASNALSFDGQTGYVNVANNSVLDFSHEMSISVWVKPKFISSLSFTGLVNKWEDAPGVGTGGYGYYLGFNPNGFEIRWNTGIVYADGTPLSLNKWSHIVVTFDATSLKIYKNGVLDLTVASGDPITSSNVDLRFGQQSEIFPSSQYYNGYMDEVLLYDKALTIDEVVQIYENDPTSVNNNYFAKGIDVFPNPCHDFFQIKSEEMPSGFLQGEIYDVQGKLMKKFLINEFNQTVSTKELENGFYIFLIRDEEGIKKREKLLKI